MLCYKVTVCYQEYLQHKSSILGALSLTIRVSYNMYSILIVDCGGREGTTNNGSDITLKSNERIRH
jgi:hypothetical protein